MVKPCEVLQSVGVDYITVTTKDPANIKPQLKIAERFLYHEEGMGNFARPWSMSGYEGWQCGELEFGMRQHETIIRMRSFCAHKFWRLVFEKAENCSRIDLEATLVSPEEPWKRVGRAYKATRKHWLVHQYLAQPKLIAGPLGPQTVYMGNRLSDIFLRVYDSFAKHKLDALKGCVRWEAEIKNRRSLPMALKLRDSKQEATTIIQHLYPMFRKRGCSPSFPSDHNSSIEVPRGAGDRDRLLAWLQAQVRPSVQALLRQGNIHAVFEALGLSVPFGPQEAEQVKILLRR